MTTQIFNWHMIAITVLLSGCFGCYPESMSSNGGCDDVRKGLNSSKKEAVIVKPEGYAESRSYRPDNYDPRFQGFISDRIKIGKDTSDFLIVPEKGQIIAVKSTSKTLEVWQRTPADFNAPLDSWKKAQSVNFEESPGNIIRAGGELYVVFPGCQKIAHVNTASGKLGPEVALPKDPFLVAAWPNFSALAIGCNGSQEIIVIDLKNMSIVSRQKLPNTPAMLTVDAQVPGIVHVGYSDRTFTSMIQFNDSGKVTKWKEMAYEIKTNYHSIHAYAGYLYVAPVNKNAFVSIDLATGCLAWNNIRNLMGEDLEYLAMGPCGDHMAIVYFDQGGLGCPKHLQNRYFFGILNLTTQEINAFEYIIKPAKNVKMASSKQSFNGELYFVFDHADGILHVVAAFDEFE